MTESNMVNWMKEYIENTPLEEQKRDWAKIEEMGFEGPNVYQYLSECNSFIKAMVEYARQESISFLEWSNSEGWQTYDSWHTWINCDTRQVLTTEQLYLLFKEKNP